MRFAAVSGKAVLSVYQTWVRARAKLFSRLSGGAFAQFGKRSVIQLPLRISGAHRISIGDDVFIGSDSWLDVAGDGDSVVLEIGAGTRISGHCVLSAASSVRFGAKVLLARNVYVSDHNHAFDDLARPVLEQGLTEPAPVLIEDGAWLGENVVVCPGVTIGRGAVVGANAVVLSDIPAFAVAVGVPARVVRIREPLNALA